MYLLAEFGRIVSACCYRVLCRCAQLTFHVRLPYSALQTPYVESAIRATYKKNICNCTVSVKVTLANVDFTI